MTKLKDTEGEVFFEGLAFDLLLAQTEATIQLKSAVIQHMKKIFFFFSGFSKLKVD